MKLTILWLNIEQYDSNFVFWCNILIKKNWNNIPHVISDSFTFSIGSHGQILFNFAKFIHVTLKHLNFNIDLENSELLYVNIDQM